MKSFVTGSRSYGEPRRNSDIDLVILVSQSDLEKLRVLCPSVNDGSSMESDNFSFGSSQASLVWGNLNIVAFTDATAFVAWEKANCQMRRWAADNRPITRGEAVAYLDLVKRRSPTEPFPDISEVCVQKSSIVDEDE